MLRIATAIAVACSLTGCLSMKSYVDPKLHDLAWSAIKAPAQSHPGAVDVEFYRNGERYTRADGVARGAVERALQKSGVVALQPTSASRFVVKVNNMADMGDAAKKGFGVGLTFGAKGTTVTDGYEVTIRYEEGGRTVEKVYQHALHSTIGNAEPATSATPMTPVQAFDQVIEDAVIHFLRDAQSEGVLVLRGATASPSRA